MKKKLLFAVLPALMALGACSGASNPKIKYWQEDTLLHEELFGALPNLTQSEDSPSRKNEFGVDELYTPRIAVQQKQTGSTYAVRFVAAIEDTVTEAFWTRSVHDIDGNVALEKTTKEVKKVYTSLQSAATGDPTSPGDVVEKDDEAGTKPFDYFAVYCLLGIPASHKDFFVDAYLTATNGPDTKSSNVGSVKALDGSHMSYSISAGTRYVGEVNGVLRESETPEGTDVLKMTGVDLVEGETVGAYYIDATKLTYTRYDYSDIVRANVDFEEGENGELASLRNGTFNFFLNSSLKFCIEKKIYYECNADWNYDGFVTMIELKHENGGSGEYKSFQMTWFKNVNWDAQKQYYAFVDISYYTSAQWYAENNGNKKWYTGFKNFPSNGDNFYINGSDSWGYT